MRNTAVLVIIVCLWLTIPMIEATAFVLQDSVELSYPNHSPYPNVLSPAINILPEGFVTINVGYETYYYCKGIFYQKIMLDQKYVLVPPPIGAVVFNLPQGYQLMLIDGISYYQYAGVYYKRVLEGYKVIYPPPV